ncbi:hypothetical protein AMAG_20097 [Allomyces macrogynus ATCC 38327]|uniref:Uncharacterized protein n=1 Tax=Allomyces macrogynus (strain ATCC 38327) TaxID=578462 RepID=A0A0L0T729_ALLM3|nr:hypothetical protein AMAG_20097 [Allomyces macrogynus ATCC 38327]|eukprot:KNE70384.1 hypothetical protein AMAG_20097 [Allomyces macrogynus ATCC 38327]
MHPPTSLTAPSPPPSAPPSAPPGQRYLIILGPFPRVSPRPARLLVRAQPADVRDWLQAAPFSILDGTVSNHARTSTTASDAAAPPLLAAPSLPGSSAASPPPAPRGRSRSRSPRPSHDSTTSDRDRPMHGASETHEQAVRDRAHATEAELAVTVNPAWNFAIPPSVLPGTPGAEWCGVADAPASTSHRRGASTGRHQDSITSRRHGARTRSRESRESRESRSYASPTRRDHRSYESRPYEPPRRRDHESHRSRVSRDSRSSTNGTHRSPTSSTAFLPPSCETTWGPTSASGYASSASHPVASQHQDVEGGGPLSDPESASSANGGTGHPYGAHQGAQGYYDAGQGYYGAGQPYSAGYQGFGGTYQGLGQGYGAGQWLGAYSAHCANPGYGAPQGFNASPPGMMGLPPSQQLPAAPNVDHNDPRAAWAATVQPRMDADDDDFMQQEHSKS